MSNDAASPSQPESPPRREGTGGVAILVCVAGGLAGALFGGSVQEPGSLGFGLAGGVLAGIVWSWIMLSRAARSAGHGGFVAAGTGWGVLVGLLATAVLHGGPTICRHLAGLPWAESLPDDGIMMTALMCALWAGAGTGAICGWVVSANRK